MASTYSTNLRVELQANGENSTTWGTKANAVFNMLEQAISGVASVAMTDAEYTLTTANGSTDEARNAVITMTGTLTASRNVIVPSVDKLYTFKNSTTGGYSIVVKTSGGTGVTIANGDTLQVYCDATNVLPAATAFGSALSVANGGTGRATSTTAYGLLAAGTTATGAHQTLAAGLTTQILVGGGASALPVWTAATGSGAPVRATSPTLTTPVLGVASATTINGITIKTCPAGIGSTNTVAVGGSTTGTALQNDGTGCSFFGDAAGSGVTTGDRNTFVGFGSGTGTTTASDNVCVGAYSGSGLTVGNSNTLVGTNTGYASMTGSTNTLLGFGAGASVDGAAPYIGSGGNNIAIGYQSEPSASNVSNTATIGNSSITVLRCQVTSITALSDSRDKTDIVPLPSGLDTVMELNPVRFTWNMRDGGKVGVKDSGFIAQDLQTVDDEWLRLVYAENPEKLEASYGRLIPVLVKAIQELKTEVDNLRSQLL